MLDGRAKPILARVTEQPGRQRKGEAVAELRPETVTQLGLLGRERALIYKTLLLTGLRLNELRSLTVGQLHLDDDLPYVILDAADEKNREGSTLPLRLDLAMGVYVDPKLLDVHGAMDSLPAMPLDTERRSIRQVVKATGTDDLPTSPLAPVLAPTSVKSCKSASFADKSAPRNDSTPSRFRSTQLQSSSMQTAR